MATHNLSEEFATAQSRINLGRRRLVAQAAHLEVRAVLKLCCPLMERGLNDVLIGSYARDTGIWPGKDVDVFGKLTDETVDSITPAAAYELFWKALEPYGDRLTPQARSIKVAFDKDRAPRDEYLTARDASRRDVFPFSVDVVPAVRSGNVWAIPTQDRTAWQRAVVMERWVRTDPETLNDLTTERNRDLSIGGQGGFVPTVKAIRHIRRVHLGDAKPGGLFFELVLHEGFQDGQVRGESWADVTAGALTFVAQRLREAATRPVCDPAMNQPYIPAPDTAQLSAAIAVFDGLADEAGRALTTDKCAAAATWRGIFGSNSNGPVFPLSPGCREDGTTIMPVPAINPLRGSNEARGFGGW